MVGDSSPQDSSLQDNSPQDNITIIAIDPGQINVGVAIYICDYNMNIKNIYHETYYFKELIDRNKDTFYRPWSYLSAIMVNKFDTLLNHYKPDFVAAELPFISRLALHGGIQVSIGLAMVETSVGKYNGTKTIKDSTKLPIIYLNPKSIKRDFTGDGSADKHKMLQTMKNCSITKFVDTNSMSEHAIDAVAMGLTVVKKIRKNPMVLL